MDWSQPMAHIAKTTSAAPTFFLPVKGKDGYEFVDGGIWANNPIMVGIADTLSCYDLKREQIKVLSLGCVKDFYQMSKWRNILGGLIFWTNLMFECMHIQSQNVVGQARLIIGGDNVIRVDSDPITPKIELSDWERSCAMLPGIADGLFEIYGQATADKFFVDRADPYEPIYTPDNPPQ